MIIVIFFRDMVPSTGANVDRIDNVIEFFHRDGYLFIKTPNRAYKSELNSIAYYQVIP